MKEKSIDAFISSYPAEIQQVLQNIRVTIQSAAPNAEEAISYGIPTFKLNGKNLVHFSALKKHIGFYPTPSGIKQFEKELKGYECAKGSIKFPLDKPIPYSLIKKIVKFRLKESIPTSR